MNHPTYQGIPSPHSRFPILARAMSNFTQQVRTWLRRPQLPNTPQHGGAAPLGLPTLGKGPDLQPTRSERMLKPAAHLRSTSTRHLGPGRTQHQNPAPSSGVGNGRKQQQQQQHQHGSSSGSGLFLQGRLPSSDYAVCLPACRSICRSVSLLQRRLVLAAIQTVQSRTVRARRGGGASRIVRFRWPALAPTLHRAATTNGTRAGTRQERTNDRGARDRGT